MEMQIPVKNGVCFEEILHTLKVGGNAGIPVRAQVSRKG